jgi:probable HAF family extracellular repeat protein
MGTVLPITALAVTPAQLAGIPETYSITDLNAVNFYDARVFTALNDNGQLTGNYMPPGAVVPHAFLYNTGPVDLGTLPALGTSSSTFGISINASGQVAGNAVGAQTQHSFLGSGSTLTDLGFLPGGAPYSAAAGVNASGQVTGYAFSSDTGNYAADFALRHAYLYSNGALTDLGTLQSGGYSYGTAINDSGQIVGGASVPVPAGAPPGKYEHAFYYSNGVPTEYPLPAAQAVFSTYATAINNNGLAVGSVVIPNVPGAATPTIQSAAEFSTPGIVAELGDINGTGAGMTTALAINDAGTIVGTSDGAAFISTATHTVVDLNIFLDPTDPLMPSVYLSSALAINNAGVILAQATVSGATHYLLLTLQPLTFVPTKTSFADTVAGTPSAPQAVTVINLGTAAVTLADFSITGDFSQSNTCGASLAGQSECTINVTFTPTVVGVRNGTIVFTSDGASHIYQLEGGGSFAVSLKTTASPIVGQPFTLVWSSMAGAVCNAVDARQGDGWNGAILASSGSMTVTEISAGMVDFFLDCTLNGITEQAFLNLNIAAAAPPPPPATTHSGGGAMDPMTLLILGALAARTCSSYSSQRKRQIATSRHAAALPTSSSVGSTAASNGRPRQVAPSSPSTAQRVGR